MTGRKATSMHLKAYKGSGGTHARSESLKPNPAMLFRAKGLGSFKSCVPSISTVGASDRKKRLRNLTLHPATRSSETTNIVE